MDQRQNLKGDIGLAVSPATTQPSVYLNSPGCPCVPGLTILSEHACPTCLTGLAAASVTKKPSDPDHLLLLPFPASGLNVDSVSGHNPSNDPTPPRTCEPESLLPRRVLIGHRGMKRWLWKQQDFGEWGVQKHQD